MIYFDNAATTRPDGAAFDKAAQYTRENFFNPSASYGGGFLVHGALEEARSALLSHVADPAKFALYFTSGGTEADNHAVLCGARRGNAVASAGEHAAVERAFNELKNRGVEPRFAPLNRDGSVDTDRLLSLVDGQTSLVSVMHVNNETGAVNDVAAIARAVKKKNPRTLFMSDGVQAYGKLAFRLTDEIDLYTVSAHKIGGLKGTGALIKRKSLALPPFVHGGGQEGGMRSGTENIFGILDFRYAAEKKFASLGADGVRLAEYKKRLASALSARYTVLSSEGSPYILTVSLEGGRGEVLQRMLWDRGVVVGTGSACSSKHRHSRVIAACGYGEKILDGVLRISFSAETTEEEIGRAAVALDEVAREFTDKV